MTRVEWELYSQSAHLENNDLIFCSLAAKIAGPIRKTSPHTRLSLIPPMQAQIKSPGARIYIIISI